MQGRGRGSIVDRVTSEDRSDGHGGGALDVVGLTVRVRVRVVGEG